MQRYSGKAGLALSNNLQHRWITPGSISPGPPFIQLITQLIGPTKRDPTPSNPVTPRLADSSSHESASAAYDMEGSRNGWKPHRFSRQSCQTIVEAVRIEQKVTCIACMKS
jgi:hypothetical protein